MGEAAEKVTLGSWSAGSDSTDLTSIDEAKDAERDGNVHALNAEFLPQGAEKSVQGKLSCRVGDRKGKPDFTWTQSEVLLQPRKLLRLNPCFALHQKKNFTQRDITVSEMSSWHLNSSITTIPDSFQLFQGLKANTMCHVFAQGMSNQQ